jgi:L-amino acid N-acyltransferase
MSIKNDLIIRKATEADIPGILEIYNDAILNTTALYTYEPFTGQMMHQWFADKTAKALPVLVATAAETGGEDNGESNAQSNGESNSQSNGEDNGQSKIAGFASYGPFRPWPAYKYTVEHSIYVHKDHRGKGIAKQLLHTLIDHATAAGFHTLVAGIDSENAVSINLHRRFGFKETGQLAQVGYKFERWLDLVFMQLILDNNGQPNEK